ncbi:DUF3526 domain-containing protein, partial [Elizabethkingia anophelis]|uniref:DUF3526 domain-containing protein n=1 Tax=Elizabethkingia anophelis TaxID=1117645 RepID=UPI0021AB8892
NAISTGLSFINPFLAIRNLSMALTGSDFNSYTSYQEQVENYRYQLAQLMNKLQMENISNKKQGATGDGKGTAAIGNLLKGRGSKDGSQGDGGKIGNAGDPLGGDGNGDSKIGVDRKLTGYIPGTMGRGGAQPSHSCSASGSITLSYTVDKAGNVISVRRSGGISDPCIVSTSLKWVKQYVKAEKANFSSTGTYRITF